MHPEPTKQIYLHKHKVIITHTLYPLITVGIRVYLVKLHMVVVVVDIHRITMIVSTVVMVVPVVVLLGTTVTIPQVVRVFPVKVITVEMQQTLITIQVVVVVPVKRERVQIPNHTVVMV